MPRVTRVIAAGADPGRFVDSVLLTADARRVQRGELVGAKGAYLLELATPVRLRMGDALELEDGSLVEVVAEAEPLIEARGVDLVHLAKLAWHLGDRHVPVQVLGNRLRLQHDPAIEALLQSLGARLTAIEAPFDPEGGAYAADDGHQGHRHGHGGHYHHDGCHHHAHESR
jgi:urease accessory protein